MSEFNTRLFSSTVTVYNRQPPVLETLQAQISDDEKMRKNQDDMVLQAAINLGAQCRDPFHEIPGKDNKKNKRRAESMRNVHDLLLQTYGGLMQVHQIIGTDPQSLSSTIQGMGCFKRSNPHRIVTALAGLSYALYPNINIDPQVATLYTSFGALGLLRITVADDFRSFSLVENALSYALKEPVTGKLLIDYREIFDGGLAVRDDINQWNLVQDYPKFVNGNDYY